MAIRATGAAVANGLTSLSFGFAFWPGGSGFRGFAFVGRFVYQYCY